MVTRKPFRAPNVESTPATRPADAWIGIGLVVAVLIGLGSIGRCSGTPAPGNSAAFVDGNVSNGIAAQTPPPVEPLSATAVTRGTAHLRVAVTAEGFPGAMIYSQNCYDSLSRQFTWAKLDQCGAFDMVAVRSIATADTGNLTSEAGYFQSEAAAGRYLAAATAAGEPAGEADTRLSDLQTRARRAPVAGRRPAPAPSTDIGNTVNAAIPADDGGDGPIDDLVDE